MRRCIVFVMAIAGTWGACTHKPSVKELAGYVSDPENGLTRRMAVGNKTVISQFVPSENPGNDEDPFRFRVWIKNENLDTTDSVLYHFNYHSSEMFRLVAGKDTIEPLLSERIANGRRDLHEFTLLFPNEAKQMKDASGFSLLLFSNPLFPNLIDFKYQYKDITKASKKLYGYDQVTN